MIVRLLNGIATAIATTATGTIAAYVTPPTRKSEGISLFSLSLVLGTAIGPFFGMLLMNSFSIQILFMICVILGVLSGLLSLFIKIDFKTVASKMIRLIEKHLVWGILSQRSNSCCDCHDVNWCHIRCDSHLLTSICS